MAGGRTFLDRHGKTRWQLERMHNGVRYSRRLDARNESEALAELALLRDPDAYLTKAEAAEKAEAEAVLMDAERVSRFLAHLKAEGRTEHYRRNLRTYLAQWAEPLAGKDLREVTLQEFKRELAKRPTARKHDHRPQELLLVPARGGGRPLASSGRDVGLEGPACPARKIPGGRRATRCRRWRRSTVPCPAGSHPSSEA